MKKNILINRGVKQYPRGISVDSSSNSLFVNNMGGGCILEFNLSTRKLIQNFPIMSNPGHHTLSADKNYFYICDNAGKAFYKYSRIDKKTIKKVSFKENALLFADDPSEKFAVVLHWYNSKASVVDLDEMRILDTLKIQRPIGVDFGDGFFIISSYGVGGGKLTKYNYNYKY
jgi:DNA-binding beta-propeller fold protein YncE